MVGITLGNRVPNLRKVGQSQLYRILIIGFMVCYMRVPVLRELIGASIMVSYTICLEII